MSRTRQLITAAVIIAGITGCARTVIHSAPLPAQSPVPAITAPIRAEVIPDATVKAAPAPSAGVSYNASGDVYPVPACTDIGGDTIENLDGGPECADIPYLGPDGQTYTIAVGITPRGTLQGPAATVILGVSTGATEEECESGRYPDGPAGPVTGAPGYWDTRLALCLPSAPAGTR